MISHYLGSLAGGEPARWAAIGGRRVSRLRYGENPQQWAALCHRRAPARRGKRPPGAGQGTRLQQPRRCRRRLRMRRRVRCRCRGGVRDRQTPIPAEPLSRPRWSRPTGWRCGPIRVSAFGGIVAFDRPLDAAAAQAVSEIFTEVVMAPAADEEQRLRDPRRRPRICTSC